MLLVYATLLQSAQAEFDIKSYAVGAVSTAISMPITYKIANGLTRSSNRLVVGLLPPLLAGVLLPSTVASVSVHYGRNYLNNSNSRFDIGIWGQTVGLQTTIFTGAAFGKMDTNETSNRVLYTSINTLLLPLPMLLSQGNDKKQVRWDLSIQPTAKGTFLSGGYYGTF